LRTTGAEDIIASSKTQGRIAKASSGLEISYLEGHTTDKTTPVQLDLEPGNGKRSSITDLISQIKGPKRELERYRLGDSAAVDFF
jgi:hypothetical protein